MLRGLRKYLKQFRMTLETFSFRLQVLWPLEVWRKCWTDLYKKASHCYSWGLFLRKFPRVNRPKVPNFHGSTMGEQSSRVLLFFSVFEAPLNSLWTTVVSITFTWNAWALPMGKSILLLLIFPAVWTNPVCGHHNQGTSLLVGGTRAV